MSIRGPWECTRAPRATTVTGPHVPVPYVGAGGGHVLSGCALTACMAGCGAVACPTCPVRMASATSAVAGGGDLSGGVGSGGGTGFALAGCVMVSAGLLVSGGPGGAHFCGSGGGGCAGAPVVLGSAIAIGTGGGGTTLLDFQA